MGLQHPTWSVCSLASRKHRGILQTPLNAFARRSTASCRCVPEGPRPSRVWAHDCADFRSEEHTSELQSRENLVCRLLLEKKKVTTHQPQTGSRGEREFG